MKMSQRLLVVLLVVLSFAGATWGCEEEPTPIRAIWVTRWDYRTPDDVRRVVGEVASLGVTDILWQARGQADAFYRSELEPWGRELFVDLPVEKQAEAAKSGPGFDPLEHAIVAAHSRGIRLHAWFNVMPLWKGTTAPTDPSHVFNTHPKWRLKDRAGDLQPLNEHYIIVNPVLPAVHEHIVAVAKDIMSRYAVDGLHLDYVRFVSDTMDKKKVYPGDPESLALFEGATGTHGIDSDANLLAYRVWIRSRITDLVRRLQTEAVRARKGAVLTAAVWRRPDIARDTYQQDAAVWLHTGTLDRAFPMVYSVKDEQVAGDLAAWVKAAPASRVTPGLGAYLHAPGQTQRQIEAAAQATSSGYALFGYAGLFESVDPNQDKGEKAQAERGARLESLRQWMAGAERSK